MGIVSQPEMLGKITPITSYTGQLQAVELVLFIDIFRPNSIFFVILIIQIYYQCNGLSHVSIGRASCGGNG